MNFLYGGYFGGWYVLFGIGFIRWVLVEPDDRSWWMIAFGAFAYFLLIPSLVLGMVGPIFEKIATRSEAEMQTAFDRRTLTRGYAFGTGFVLSLMAMVTSFIAWAAASMEPDFFSLENLGENGLAVVMVSLMMGIIIVIALFPWLGVRHLLSKSRRQERGAQSTWFSRVAPIAAVLICAALIGWLGYRIATSTNTMTMRLDFAGLPANDQALQDWFDSQPGIDATVSRDGQTVVIEYAVSALWTSGSSQFFDELVLDYSTLGGTKHSLRLTDATANFGYGRLLNSSTSMPQKRW
jgi:hypothetical protein